MAQHTGKAEFEQVTDKAIKQNRVRRRFQQLQADQEAQLQARRERLTELLEYDSAEQRKALVLQEETPEQRIEKMRTRLGQLREKREQERLKVVETKLEQKFRNGCDELRQIQSHLAERHTATEWKDQIAEKKMAALRIKDEEHHYHVLWEQDRQRKIHREETDAARRRALNAECLAALNQQMNELRAKAEEDLRLKEDEARIMRQVLEMRKLEDHRKRVQHLEDQALYRAKLDRFNKYLIQQKLKAVKESLELDLSILEEVKRADEAERANNARMKEKTRQELLAFQEHLRRQKIVEQQRAKELETLYIQEIERNWCVREEKWHQEQIARDQLMSSILKERAEQIDEKVSRNRQRQEELHREQEALHQQIDEWQRVLLERRVELAAQQEDYRKQLDQQVRDLKERRRLESERIEAEIVKIRAIQDAYIRKVEVEIRHAYEQN